MFDPPPFNPELPCELLAENTFEALRIVRQGDWVYKFLRPHDSFPGQTAEQRRRQILLRVGESHEHVLLNPLAYDSRENQLISRFVRGLPVGTDKCKHLAARLFYASGGRICDITPNNVRITENGFKVIDFTVNTPKRDQQPIYPIEQE